MGILGEQFMKSLNYLFIASLICMPLITHAMQQQNNGSRIFYTDGRGLQDAPEIIHSFVHKNIQDIGLNDSTLSIKVGTYNADVSWAAKPGIIALPFREVNPENPKSLINLLQKQQHTPEETEKINLCRSIVQHEATHLKNNDSTNNRIAQWVIFGASTLPLVYGWLKKGSSTTNTQAAMKRLAFIPATITALLANGLANAAYSRYVEQRADNGIANNIDILQAAANKYRKAAEEDKRDGRSDLVFEQLSSTHPSNKQRADRFEQRIAKLKEQQIQK